MGAILRYTLQGEENITEVVPDFIVVKPMPVLKLDYFIPANVYGDEPFTELIEPSVPFALGVRARNMGYGLAPNLTVLSGQPEIVENEQGLLIDFRITGSQVNGKEATKDFLVNFGDLAPNQASVAHWIMETTLSGRFVTFEAEFTHDEQFGGELTSLIEGIDTHLMVRDVLVDLPGRDRIREFLAVDEGFYSVYESTGLDLAVSNLSAQATFASDSNASNQYVLNVPPIAGPFFVRIDQDLGEHVELATVVRQDGKEIHEANGWISEERNPKDKKLRVFYFNLFDVNGGGDYLVTLTNKANTDHAPVLAYIGPRSTGIGEALGFRVTASDADATIPSLSASGVPSTATFVQTTNSIRNATAEFYWIPGREDWGEHRVTFTATDEDRMTDSEDVVIRVGQPAGPFVAYNDLSWDEGQLAENITRYTTENTTDLPPEGSSGFLVDFLSGERTLITMTVRGGDWIRAAHAKQGGLSIPGTDGFNAFAGIVDGKGVISYGDSDIELEFCGLDSRALLQRGRIRQPRGREICGAYYEHYPPRSRGIPKPKYVWLSLRRDG